MTASVENYQKKNAPLIPVSIDTGSMLLFYKKGHTIPLDSTRDPRGWTNYYRSDDLSAVSYFYLETPDDHLPPLQNVAIRTCNLRTGLAIKTK